MQGNKLTVDEQQVTEESAIYRAEWVTTGLTKSQKGERQTISVVLQVSSTCCGRGHGAGPAVALLAHRKWRGPLWGQDKYRGGEEANLEMYVKSSF